MNFLRGPILSQMGLKWPQGTGLSVDFLKNGQILSCKPKDILKVHRQVGLLYGLLHLGTEWILSEAHCSIKLPKSQPLTEQKQFLQILKAIGIGS